MYIGWKNPCRSVIKGCLNGGGQIRPDTEESPKDLLVRVQEMYNQPEMRNPWSSLVVEKLYSEWLEGRDSDKALKLLHTTYKEIEKPNNPLTMKW